MTRARELADLLTGGQTISTADNNPQLTFKSTDTDSGHGPRLNMERNPSEAGADGDNLGQIFIQGYNDAGTPELIDYFQLFTEIADASDGTEDARQIHYVMTGGSQRSRIEHNATETVFNEDSVDVDFRVESNGNANMLFVDAGNDRIGLGTNSPSSPVQLHATGSVRLEGLFYGADGSASAPSIRFWNAASGLYYPGSDALGFVASGSEAMRISSGGAVNIGGTGAQAKFEVNNAVSTTGSLTDTTINLATTGVTGRKANIGFGLAGGVANTNAATIGFDVTSGSGALQGDLFFSTRGSTSDSVPTERMRILSGGALLVGGTSAVINSDSKLGVHGRIDASASGTTPLSLNRSGSDGVIIDFLNDGSAGIGNVSVSGSNVSFNTSSDYRLKEAVVDMTGAIDRVKQLAPKRFNFIRDADKVFDGFLAHEAQAVVPEAVTGTKDEVDDDGNAVMQGIDQSKLVPLLTAALKESIAKIETLETKVAALEGA